MEMLYHRETGVVSQFHIMYKNKMSGKKKQAMSQLKSYILKNGDDSNVVVAVEKALHTTLVYCHHTAYDDEIKHPSISDVLHWMTSDSNLL